MPKGPQKPVVSKKHLARMQREQLQNRYIMIVAAVVIGIVVLLIGWGIVNQIAFQRQPIAIVAGDAFSTNEFQNYVRFSRYQLLNQYSQYQNIASMFGTDEASQSYFTQYLSQIEYQLTDPLILGQQALDQLIEDKLIRQEAARRGITVTEAEVDALIESLFGYYPNGTPTPAATLPVLPTSTLSPLQLTLVPPTATATAPAETATPTTVPSPTVAPTADTVSTPTALPTPYTEALYRADYKEQLSTTKRIAGLSESEFRWLYEMSLYREKVTDAITADITHEQDQVWARHILVADKASAQLVLDRLNNGEDFAAIAAEVSTDSSNAQQGGDLGWFGTGVMDPAFEQAAFSLGIGETSEPVQSSFGWHIIQVLGHEVRSISDAEFQNIQDQAMQDWLTAQREASDVQIFDYWKERIPTDPVLYKNSSY